MYVWTKTKAMLPLIEQLATELTRVCMMSS